MSDLELSFRMTRIVFNVMLLPYKVALVVIYPLESIVTVPGMLQFFCGPFSISPHPLYRFDIFSILVPFPFLLRYLMENTSSHIDEHTIWCCILWFRLCWSNGSYWWYISWLANGPHCRTFNRWIICCKWRCRNTRLICRWLAPHTQEWRHKRRQWKHASDGEDITWNNEG